MYATYHEKSLQEAVDTLLFEIGERGFSTMLVGDAPDDRGLAYTVGLFASRNHPEVLIAGYPLLDANEILDAVGRYVLSGRRIDRWRSFNYRGATRCGLVKVDRIHLNAGLLRACDWCYGRTAMTGFRALQAVLPDDQCCYEHQRTQPLFGSFRRRRPRAKDPADDRLVIRLPT